MTSLEKIFLPVQDIIIQDLKLGDRLLLSGTIFTGRDAALPRLVELIKRNKNPLDLKGSAIMHTAVSGAGISPTTSNKVEIEKSIPALAAAGVKIHIGKGSLSPKTIEALNEHNSIFVVTPPAAALLSSKIKSNEVVAFREEGMEAIHQLEVDGIPGIVYAVRGESL